MDPLGDRVVYQFAQDAGAFYAAMNEETTQQGSQPFERASSVVRVDKATGTRSTLLNPQRMTITDPTHSGYLGVVSDGTDVFALFEAAPVNGTSSLQIDRVARAAQAAPQNLAPVFVLPISADPYYTSLQLLGAVDGAVVFSRNEYESSDGADSPPTLRSSSVLIIPQSGGVRYVADFLGDGPTRGVAAIGDRIFWLNQSGRVYGLSREALASD